MKKQWIVDGTVHEGREALKFALFIFYLNVVGLKGAEEADSSVSVLLELLNIYIL